MAVTTLEGFAKRYLRAYWATFPSRASALGLHGFDGNVTDYDPAAIERRVADLEAYRRELEDIAAAMPPIAPPDQDWLDQELLRLAIERELFEWQTLREWARNPMGYLFACDVSHYLKRDYAPLPSRLKGVMRHLDNIPGLLAQARANLDRPVPRTFVEISLSMIGGIAGFIRDDLAAFGDQAEDAALQRKLEQSQQKAVAALGFFQTWLRDEVLPAAGDQYAIGGEALAELLRVGEAVELPLDELLRIGREDLRRNKAEFEQVASRIAPGRPATAVMRDLIRHHPKPYELIPTAQAMMDSLRAFVIERDLVSVPYNLPLTVAETPVFMRWASAMMDAPGVLDKTATESFYYITPPERDWPAEKVEEWLSQFDYSTMEDMSIHEAWPGHFLHWLHFRDAPSPVTQVFDSYSFWEGWAHYVEQMMIEQGYGNGNLHLHLAQLAEALLRDVRLVCAIGLHTQEMDLEQATGRFVEDAYMEELPARKEAERGTFDPGYLAYTLGKLMVAKLREDWAREQGDKFSLKRFHDTFLSFGAPPIPLLRKMMLRNDDGRIFLG